MDERNSTVSLEMARNGSPVAKVRGVYLHSVYDPEKEADSFVETYEKQISTKNHILIFGLGLGYHVNRVVKSLRSTHHDYRVVVLESNSELISLVSEQGLVPSEKVRIIHLDNYESLYSDRTFVDFLMKKPCLLKHEASFSIDKDLYTGFLKYKSSKSIADYSKNLSETTKTLLNIEGSSTIGEVAESIQNNGRISNRSEYLTLAFGELLTQTRKGL